LAGEVSGRDAAQAKAAKCTGSGRSKSFVTADHRACSDRVRLAPMQQVRAHSDRTLALLYRTGWRRPGRIFNDRGIDREGVAGLLRADELLELLKLDEIKLFLVQVRSQFGHRRPEEEYDERDKTDSPYSSRNSGTIPPPCRVSSCPSKLSSRPRMDLALTEMWRQSFGISAARTMYIYTD
jgi:hypothetical protein